MGEMTLNQVQQELLVEAARALERVQDQNQMVLTAILAGDSVRKANNVRHEGDRLLWDDPPTDEGGEPPAEVVPEPPAEPDIVGKVVDQILDDAPSKVEGDPSETTGPALHEEGDSEGPEASVPDEKDEASEVSEPAPEEEEPVAVH